ncbi:MULTISPECIES: response regulator transcription factor [unclassified Fusibacter]|uniref:response regulator transcription factor n=1 Tax=unclassified Fusibacter TaxID=2624464 RepID=UPI001FA9F558|nr:response regulator transcription factor [Fusibacter sp. A1]MCK8059408.1 response regulator transcription factor [Fusibacter sp. A2]
MRHTILVCEDEYDIRDLIVTYLNREGFNTISAHNGVKSLDMYQANSNEISLILLDIMMPGLDGYEVLRKIREQSNVPVIFLTARSDEEDKIHGLGLGADDYVVKPFSLKEISSRIKAQIRRNTQYIENSSSTLIVNGPLTLDLNQYFVKKDDEILNLNPKEFSMMKLFMENLEQVFTKKQLYESIWNDPFYGDANTIMVHISHIREKIEENPKQPKLLRTIRGIGYRMERIE